MKFDPWLLGAIQKAMGVLPAIQADLAKVKSLTFFDGAYSLKEPGTVLNGWMEVAPGEFSAIGKMPNLHTLLFKNHRVLNVGDFGFLSGCTKLKKLDLSGTDFSDCRVLAALPLLQYAMLPDRQLLAHTEILDEIKAFAESEQEMDERARAGFYAAWETQRRKEIGRSGFIKGKSMPENPHTADARLIRWIAVSLGKLPDKWEELDKIRILDCRKRNASLEAALFKKADRIEGMPQNHSLGKLPSWLMEKEGDFSLMGELPNLQALLLWGVCLEDFSFLSKCRGLLYLNLWDTNFSDCGLLAQLPVLSYVCLPKREQLINYSALEARKKVREQEEKRQMEGFWYGGDDVLEAEALCPGHAAQLMFFPQKHDKDAPGRTGHKKPETSQEDVSAAAQRASDEGAADLRPEGDKATAYCHETDPLDLVTVKGEDVVISYEGSFGVRHVIGEFCMDSTPKLWKAFSKLEEEEDNWARLDAKRVEQLTKELMEAIMEGNVATLYLSLEPWGEGHMFIVEFTGGWAEITYRDDITPVCYIFYNPAYANPAELSPIEYEGQRNVRKMLALDDLALTAEIVRHILETGQLLPGTLWKAGGE